MEGLANVLSVHVAGEVVAEDGLVACFKVLDPGSVLGLGVAALVGLLLPVNHNAGHAVVTLKQQ